MDERYEAPQITIVGSLEQLTQGGAEGSRLDADFGQGTEVSDLTFS